MNKILERAIAHCATVQSLEIPEWGEPGNPLFVQWTGVTSAEASKVARMMKAQAAPEEQFSARIVILKARGADGNPLFADEDLPLLLNKVAGSVVGRIATAMMAVPSLETTIKN